MTVPVHGAYIELQQLLKRLDIVQSGGEVKIFLAETEIIVNGDYESRRGRKLYPGDILVIEGIGTIEITGEITDAPTETPEDPEVP
jgi:ribosome-associated protein